MKTTVETDDPLVNGTKAVAVNEKPRCRLSDGSFKGGHGLQPGVRWEDLSTLAYDEAASVKRRSR
jgi:hypothetical protein